MTDVPKKKHVLGQNRGLHALVLVALSPCAYRDPQKTADRLARYKEVKSVDILAGNGDLALDVETETQEELYGFLKRIVSKEGEIAKTNSLISLKRIEHTYSKKRIQTKIGTVFFCAHRRRVVQPVAHHSSKSSFVRSSSFSEYL